MHFDLTCWGYSIWREMVIWSALKRGDSLRQDQNLNYEDAEEDQAGAGDVVLKSRQGCGSVLWKVNTEHVLKLWDIYEESNIYVILTLMLT